MGLPPRAITPTLLTCGQASVSNALKCADPRLWAIIWDKLELRWSPEQICAYLRMRFPHNQSMNPCVETIYQSIFIQAKGTLRKEIASLMRQGRARRRPAASAGRADKP